MSGTENKGHRQRLRERFINGEAGSRSDEALLELLLTYAIPQRCSAACQAPHIRVRQSFFSTGSPNGDTLPVKRD